MCVPLVLGEPEPKPVTRKRPHLPPELEEERKQTGGAEWALGDDASFANKHVQPAEVLQASLPACVRSQPAGQRAQRVRGWSVMQWACFTTTCKHNNNKECSRDSSQLICLLCT